MFPAFALASDASEGEVVIARLNVRAQPLDRGDVFEEPLSEVLEAQEAGEVTGGGTMLGEEGEIELCDLEIVVPEVTDEVLRTIRETLEGLGAPKGSKLIWNDGEDELDFGTCEGLAVYLNGTDLTKQVYEECDINVVYDTFGELMGDDGRVISHWQGPTETALYLYGPCARTMQAKIQPFLDTYPLCEKARIVQIV